MDRWQTNAFIELSTIGQITRVKTWDLKVEPNNLKKWISINLDVGDMCRCIKVDLEPRLTGLNTKRHPTLKQLQLHCMLQTQSIFLGLEELYEPLSHNSPSLTWMSREEIEPRQYPYLQLQYSSHKVKRISKSPTPRSQQKFSLDLTRIHLISGFKECGSKSVWTCCIVSVVVM